MNIYDLNRKRALFAYERLSEENLQGLKNEEVRSYSRKLPSMIAVNGLIKTISFYYKKSYGSKEDESTERKAYTHIYDVLYDWLSSFMSIKSKDDMVIDLCRLGEHEYFYITKEALALSEWVKNASESIKVTK